MKILITKYYWLHKQETKLKKLEIFVEIVAHKYLCKLLLEKTKLENYLQEIRNLQYMEFENFNT